MVVLTFAGSNQHSFRHTTRLDGSANLCRLQPTQPDTLVSPEDRGSRRGVYGGSVGPAHSLQGGPPQSGAAVEPPEQLSVYRTLWAPPRGQSRNSWGEDGARRKDGEKQNRKRGKVQHTQETSLLQQKLQQLPKALVWWIVRKSTRHLFLATCCLGQSLSKFLQKFPHVSLKGNVSVLRAKFRNVVLKTELNLHSLTVPLLFCSILYLNLALIYCQIYYNKERKEGGRDEIIYRWIAIRPH